MQSSSADSYSGSEMDLQALICSFWQRKWLIFGIAIGAALLAAAYAYAYAYAFTATAVYETRIFLIPLTSNDIANVNYGRTRESDLDPFKVKEVYKILIITLGLILGLMAGGMIALVLNLLDENRAKDHHGIGQIWSFRN